MRKLWRRVFGPPTGALRMIQYVNDFYMIQEFKWVSPDSRRWVDCLIYPLKDITLAEKSFCDLIADRDNKERSRNYTVLKEAL